MDSEVFQEQGKCPCQGLAVGLCSCRDSCILWILSFRRKWANSSQRPRLLCHLRTPWHVHSRLILPPLLLEKYSCQLHVNSSESSLVPLYADRCSVALRPVKIWTHGWCDQKGWWSLPEFIFEKGTLLELPKWGEKGYMGLAHFSVVLEKMWVWLPKGVWRHSATLWSWCPFLKAALIEKDLLVIALNFLFSFHMWYYSRILLPVAGNCTFGKPLSVQWPFGNNYVYY